MATTAATLEILVNARTQQAVSSLRRMDTSAKTSAKHLGNLDRTSGRLSTALGRAGRAAVAAAAGYVGISGARTAIDTTEELAKTTIGLHKNLGLTTRSAWDLGVALKARGADATKVQMAFKTFSTTLHGAATGTQTSIDRLKELGITGDKLQRDLKNPNQALLDVADGMQALGAGAARTDDLSKLFGRSWSAIAPIMRGGSGALKDNLKAVEDNGAGIGNNIGKLEDLRHQMIDAKITTIGLQVAFTTGLAPALTKILETFTKVITAFRGLPSGMKEAIGAITLLAGAIWAATAAQSAFDAAAAVNPYVLIAAAVAAAAILIITHWDQVKAAVAAAFKFIKDHALLFAAILGPIGIAMFFLVKTVANNWDKIKSIFSTMLGWIKDAWGGLKDILIGPFNWVLGQLKGFADKVINVLNEIPGVNIGGGGAKAPAGPSGPTGTGAGQPKGPSGPVGRAFGGFVPGTGSGDKVLMQAMVEPNEGVFVMNRTAMGALQAWNDAYPRRAEGGTVPRLAGGGLAGQLPSSSSLPGWVQGTGALMDAAAAKFIKKHSGSGAVGGTSGPKGTSSYMGVLMATWVAQALKYAAAHGSGNPQPTSGYRPGFDPMAPSGSEHAGTQYPHGAVDFGGMVDPPALPKKMAVVNALRGYGRRLLAPIGFRDDGHASGTGHQKGGVVAPQHGSHWLKLGHYNMDQAATLLWQAGLSMGQASDLSRVINQESGGNPHAGPSSAGAKGLFQILTQTVSGNLYDARINALNAAALYKSRGMQPWVASQSGWSAHGGTVKPGLVAGSKTKTPKKGKKKAKGVGGGGDDSGIQDMLDAAQAAIDIQNQRLGSANSLIGEGNLELLQRYQTGVAQNPLLGISSPGSPSLAASLALLPPATLADLFPPQANTIGSQGSSNFQVGQKGVKGGVGGSWKHRTPHIHNHFYIDGKEIRGVTKKEMRRASRGGRRGLPSARA